MQPEKENIQRGTDQSEPQFVDRKAYEQLLEEHVILRRAIKDCLYQAGTFSNPAWSDHDIAASIAKELGVKDRYQEISEFTKQLKQLRQKQQRDLEPGIKNFAR